jgi:Transposase DDE domain
LKVLRDEPKTVLAGKMMAVVELLTHRSLKLSYTPNPKANDKTFDSWLLEHLPIGGLLVFDLGFFKFLWFDQFSEQQKYFLTRLREKTAYQGVQTLSQGLRYRDQLIELGQYRSNPCRYRLRLVSVLWDTTWYTYLTNVLDPQQLPPHLVCELYRRRWRIEDAFALTKRLLGLAYLWVGDRNAVQIQLYATWIFYALLNDLCAQVAVALNQPLERISMEMVFRGLYHYAQALLKGTQQSFVQFLVEHHRLLAIVKSLRKRQRKRDAQFHEIWGIPALS